MDVLLILRRAVKDGKAISFVYTNYRGETGKRTVLPLSLYEGSTGYHPKRQWLLEAQDMEKNQLRHFAVADIHGGITS